MKWYGRAPRLLIVAGLAIAASLAAARFLVTRSSQLREVHPEAVPADRGWRSGGPSQAARVAPGEEDGGTHGAHGPSVEPSDTVVADPLSAQGVESTIEIQSNQKLRIAEMAAIMDARQSAEDKVLASVPNYESVKKDVRARASGLLGTVDAANLSAVSALVHDQLSAFWDAGGLVSPGSYDHAYLARALCELSLERDDSNFQTLSLLREAIGTAVPVCNHDGGTYEEADSTLWPIVDKQRQLIEQGKVPPSTETFLAMYDWLFLAQRRMSPKETLPEWEWLMKNADAAGWSPMKRFIESDLKLATAGKYYSAEVYAGGYKGPISIERSARIWAACGRRLPSIRNCKDFEEVTTPMWQDTKGTLTTIIVSK